MQNIHDSVQVREVTIPNPKTGTYFQGQVFTGQSPSIVQSIGQETCQDGASVLESIVKHLLVRKGVDWTSTILSEYLGLYQDSSGTFALVWDKAARQLVSHAAVFQSRTHPSAGLLAHVRTLDAYKGLGLGTLVTEEVTRAAFEQHAQIVVLATDDKRHRLQQGEKAAHSMYSRIGYTILAQKELADTVDWLMVIDPQIFDLRQKAKLAKEGRFPDEIPEEIRNLQKNLIAQTRDQLGQRPADGRIGPVGDGDLAHLFLLMSLCPPGDSRIKLSAWDIHLGPEFERSYVVNVRPAIVDRDRLEDATLVLRGNQGAIIAVCAARQAVPFTRNALYLDFYCLPSFLVQNRQAVVDLVAATLMRIQQSSDRPRPCRLLFTGVDEGKKALFQELGFARTANTFPCYRPDGEISFVAEQYEKLII